VVVLDFGTAVTLDVVNRAGNYAGGVHRAGAGGDDGLFARKNGLAAANQNP